MHAEMMLNMIINVITVVIFGYIGIEYDIE